MKELEKNKNAPKLRYQKKLGIDVGHLTHIENGKRNPSHKALKSISSALEVPYQPLLNTLDKTLNKDQIDYNYINYINYKQIPAISNIDFYIDCPIKFANSSFAYKMPDDSMAPTIKKDAYVFVELFGIVKHRDIGIFVVNNIVYIRKLLYRKGSFILKADNKAFQNITISGADSFQIIGKVYI